MWRAVMGRLWVYMQGIKEIRQFLFALSVILTGILSKRIARLPGSIGCPEMGLRRRF